MAHADFGPWLFDPPAVRVAVLDEFYHASGLPAVHRGLVARHDAPDEVIELSRIRTGSGAVLQFERLADRLPPNAPVDHAHFRVLNRDLRAGFLATDEQPVLQAERAAQAQTSVDLAERAVVLHAQDGVSLDSAAPVIVFIVEGSDRTEPIEDAVEHMDTKIDQRAAADLA